MTKVINFIGGPGCGKSSSSAQLFSELKWADKNVELISEYAKELTWLGHHNLLKDQFWVGANQNQRLHRLRGQVEYIITDSPLFLCLAYASPDYPTTFEPFIIDMWNSYDNVNIVLNRKKTYNSIGRNQTQSEAVELDQQIDQLMKLHNIPVHHRIDGSMNGIKTLAGLL